MIHTRFMFFSSSVWNSFILCINRLDLRGRYIDNLEIRERAGQGYQHRISDDVHSIYTWKNFIRRDSEPNLSILGNAKEFVSYPRWHEARQLSLLHDRFFVGFVRYIEISRVVSIRRFEALRPERGRGNIDDRNEGNDFKHE